MEQEPFEPLDVDDRAPRARSLDGRVGVNRFTEMINEQRLDIVALVWMLSTLTFLATQIYDAFDLFGTSGFAISSWDRVAALGQTGGPLIAVSSLVGIGLALTWDSTVARFTIVLAGVVGAWVFVAGVFNAVSSARDNTNQAVNFAGGNRVVSTVGGLALAGLGLVVMMIAWRAGSVADGPETPPEVS